MVVKPAVKKGRRTRHRPFTDDELRRFFAHCEPSHRPLFLTMLMTGARSCELLPSPRSRHVPLLKEEVDAEAGAIRLRTAKLKPGQDEKVRVVGVPGEFMEELVAYARTVPGVFVFPPNQSLKNLFDRILKRAGIPKINALGRKLTAHSFRHTYATLQARAVAFNPFLLKEILGHCQLTTTDRYCHARGEAAVVDVAGLLAGGGVKGWCEPPNETAGPEGPAADKASNFSA